MGGCMLKFDILKYGRLQTPQYIIRITLIDLGMDFMNFSCLLFLPPFYTMPDYEWKDQEVSIISTFYLLKIYFSIIPVLSLLSQYSILAF